MLLFVERFNREKKFLEVGINLKQSTQRKIF